MTRHAQITQNNKFSISLRYLNKKELRDELVFFTQISMKGCYKVIVWFWWGDSSIPKVPRITSLQSLYNISKKKLKMKLNFLYADKYQSFLKVYFNTLGIKVSFKVDIIIINGHDQAFSNQQLLCVLLWYKTFRYFTGVESCSLLLVIIKGCVNHEILTLLYINYVFVKILFSIISFR